MGRRRKLHVEMKVRTGMKEAAPRCKKCKSVLQYIGTRELDSSKLVEAGFILIKGKAGWGGQKLYDEFFCRKCKRTYVREAKTY